MVLVPALLDTVCPVLYSCRDTTTALAGLIPADQFWRWKDMWTNSLRSAVFSATLIVYLTNGTLLPLQDVGEQLGSEFISRRTYLIVARHAGPVKDEWKDKFILSVEDYLHGVISLVNELVCLRPANALHHPM